MTTSSAAPAPAMDSHVWYELTVAEVVSEQHIDPARGLTASEAAARLAQYGPNAFAAAKKEPGWRTFLRQYRDPMQIVLLVAGIISGVAVQQWGTALVLIG